MVSSNEKPWWKDEEIGWPGHGVRHFFDESRKHVVKAIEILEWGKRFSRQRGSGGAVPRFDEMIDKLRRLS